LRIIDQEYLKNQHQDLKTFSTLFKFLFASLFAAIVFCFILFPGLAFADVFIPSNEYIGYFDSNGIYTVGGNVKNQNDFAVVPTISVSVIDGNNTITKTISHVPIPPMTDIPFKIKFPEIQNQNPVLLEAQLKFLMSEKKPISITVLYDKTLITHDDGHVTGRIMNSGNQTIFNPKVMAIVHGHQNVLDIVQNIEYFEKIEPGQILDFSMYPDPSITEDVLYYSCFAPVDTTVTPITTIKNGGEFDFRFDSGAWYYGAKFDSDGTTLSINGYNSYPFDTYANFEFPPISGKEKFQVTVNDKPVNFIQSVDDMGFWHVAFDVGPTSQGVVKISGFEKGLPPEIPKIPQWIKQNASWWATNQISDSEFLEGIEFLFEKGIIFVQGREMKAEINWSIPAWVKNTAEWWSEDKISDEEFLLAIENLVSRDIIVI